MRRWHTAVIALCILFTAIVLLRLRAGRALSKYDSLTIRFVDESTGEAVSNVTVSISESRWNRVHDLLEQVGLVGPETKQRERTCTNGILTGVQILKEKRSTTALFCSSGPYDAALFVFWEGTCRGTNRLQNLGSTSVGYPNWPRFLATNGVLTLPLAR